MLKKSKVKSVTRIVERRRKDLNTATGNLYASSSVIGKLKKTPTRRQKSHFSRSSLNEESKETGPKKVAKEDKLNSNLPRDAAVHFGSFYGVQGKASKPRPGKVVNFSDSATPFYETTPRLEFTRQMVQKLERTAGTKDYARQVSALLEETVEPAHFKLHPLPAENSIPDGRYNPTGDPLWYKDPYKISVNPDDIYELLNEKYDNDTGRSTNVFEEKEESDFDQGIYYDEQFEGDECLQDNDVDYLTKEEKLSLNILSHQCSSAGEIKEDEKSS